MTDLELLGLAAKAAGIEWPQKIDSFALQRGDQKIWNPLTDDGDALRLANKLYMSISTGPMETRANTISGALRGAFFRESILEDQEKAVRRVIVCAAAEVGKSLP